MNSVLVVDDETAIRTLARRDELELDLRSRTTQLTCALGAIAIVSVESLEAVFRLVTVQDAASFGHGHRVRDLSVRIASRIGLSESDVAPIAHLALLHDLGEVLIPDAIRHKSTPLTEAESEIVRRHPRLVLIKGIPFLSSAAEIVLASHEWFDGTGYPERLSGAKIPLGSRILACADAFDAMTCRDTYRSCLGPRDAFGEIEAGRGTQFDPLVVDAFLATFGHPHSASALPASAAPEVST